MYLAAQERRYTGILEFISQPCGPRKLAKALEICIQRQRQREKEPNAFETSFCEALRTDSVEKPMTIGMSKLVSTHTEHGPLTPEVLERSSLLTTSRSNPQGHLPPLNEYPSHENQNGSSTSILLVDDNDINIRLLVAFMRKLKFNYLIARNGQEALDSFKENADKIDVILMGKSSSFQLTEIDHDLILILSQISQCLSWMELKPPEEFASTSRRCNGPENVR
jgi:hypothetical protein